MQQRFVTRKTHAGREFPIAFEWVDSGIGAYECHGFRGNDVSWGAEAVDWPDEFEELFGEDDDAMQAVLLQWENEVTDQEMVSRRR
jgi:hypothetical protein